MKELKVTDEGVGENSVTQLDVCDSTWSSRPPPQRALTLQKVTLHRKSQGLSCQAQMKRYGGEDKDMHRDRCTPFLPGGSNHRRSTAA